ncbi:hypothetical protein PoB_004823600 [Plakobranchus ocellatus]|uniref:Uncharacterized protein n=1 Tax=Plakobranchus ocellatus TaxID=259542 RepID=A0AAV4BEH3_9GAST|nr:hypothetical protein PoB_004823600 [Plakobranchus ocellatus]
MCAVYIGVCSFDVNGNFRMDPLPKLDKGNLVNFDLNVQISLEQAQDQLLLVLSGDTLEFDNETAPEIVQWKLTSPDGIVYNKTSLQLDLQESVYVPLNNDFGLAYRLNLSSGLDIGNWTLRSTYHMIVRENIVAGSLLRGILTVTAHWSKTAVSWGSRTLASNYIISPTGTVSLYSDSPTSLPIMSTFTAQMVYSASHPYSLDAEIEGYTSVEAISREVRLTVQQMVVLTNLTRGITSEAMADLQKTHASLLSSLESYQNDVALLDLPPLTVADVDTLEVENETGPEVAVNFTVRVEDYSLLQDGDQWPVHLGMGFHGNAIWLGVILISIEAPQERVPTLLVTTTQLRQCAYDGRTIVGLQTIIWHNVTSSTATAYNVTFNLYLPAYLQMTANSFTKPKDNNISVNQEGTVITAEIARLTFSDPFFLYLTLSADLSDVQVKKASKRTIVYEVVYNDRWANRTEITTNLAYNSLSMNALCSKRLTWTTSTDCTCGHDSSRVDCGCCVGGACQCGEPRPHACAPCDQMWRCVQYKKGFEEVTYLKSPNIRCDSYYLRRGRATETSCHKQLHGNPSGYLALSPVVGVVTAMDSSSGHLYGIANNGRSYVISKDSGESWEHFSDDEYTNVTSGSAVSIEWAEFQTPNY